MVSARKRLNDLRKVQSRERQTSYNSVLSFCFHYGVGCSTEEYCEAHAILCRESPNHDSRDTS